MSETPTERPRVTVGPTSAGFEEREEEAARIRHEEIVGAVLPFQPGDYAVEPGDLRRKLEEIDDVATLNRLQAADTRVTAAGEYERRINALTED